MIKSPLRAHALVALLLVGLVAVAYAPILGVPFLSDDYGLIRKVVGPGGGTDWTGVVRDFQGPLYGYRAMYRPLYSLSFAVDYSLFGTWAMGYHLTNLVLHAVSSFLVYLTALELVRAAWRWGAAITAGALFALHPIHPESVTWIAGRVDLVCAVFYFAAMLAFLRWLRVGGYPYLVLGLGAFALSLMAKEMAVTLPGLLFLLALFCGERLKGSIVRTLPFAALLGAYLLFREYILSGVEANQILSRDAGVPEILEGFVYRTLHMLLPINLGVIPFSWLRQLLDSAFHLWPLLLAGLGVLVLIRARLALLAFGLYALSLVPVLPALTRTDVLLTTSRWFYIPSAFFSILVASLVWGALADHPRWRASVAALVCAAFLGMLLTNNSVWVQAGEKAEELLAQGSEPEFPVKNKGAHVFLDVGLWQQAHGLPFQERGDLPRLEAAGEVGAVNLEEGRLALKLESGGRTAMLFGPESTRVEGGEGEAGVEDLERGQRVRVSYVVVYEGNQARFIRIKDSAAPGQ